MKIEIDTPAQGRLEEILRQDELNREATDLLSEFLTHRYDEIDERLLTTIRRSLSLSPEDSYAQAVLSTLDIDPEDEELRQLRARGFLSHVHSLEARSFRENAYLRRIRVQGARRGKWSLAKNYYQPYEGFLSHATRSLGKERDFALEDHIGFFTERVDYPVILERDHVWMSVTPYEVETMARPIALSRGRVLALGLGLGYYPFMALTRKEVEQVVVVEKDRDVLSLFATEILPQFSRPEKVLLVQADAYSYLKKEDLSAFDTVFFDIHSTAEDSLRSYAACLRLRRRRDNVSFWIEESTLAYLRQILLLLLDMEYAEDETLPEASPEILDLYLRWKEELKDVVLRTREDVDDLLSDASLRKLLLAVPK